MQIEAFFRSHVIDFYRYSMTQFHSFHFIITSLQMEYLE